MNRNILIIALILCSAFRSVAQLPPLAFSQLETPPIKSALLEWWDNRTADFTTTSSQVDTWTGRVAGTVLTGTTTTRPVLRTGAMGNYVDFSTDYLDMPTGFTLDRRNSCVFVVSRRDVLNTNTQSLFHMGDASTTHALYFVGKEVRMFNASSRTTGIYMSSGWSVLKANASASGVDVGLTPQSATVTASAAGTIADGFVGQWNGATFRFTGDVKTILVYNRTLTAGEVTYVQDWLTGRYRGTDQNTNKVRIYEGDSITFGTSSTLEKDWSYPAQIAMSERGEVKFLNVATGGAQLTTHVAGARVKTEITNNLSIGTRTVIFCFGSNDINNARTDAQVIADIDSWISTIKAHDAGIKLIGCTITPRTDFNATEETYRLSVNTHIKTVAAFDWTADFASDTRLDDATDTTYYADGIHHTDAGYAVRAELVKAVLTAQGR